MLITVHKHHIPERSLTQRREALERANDIRTYRAELKRDLKAGRENVIKLLRDPPEKIETMKVFDLLIAAPLSLVESKSTRLLILVASLRLRPLAA
jgi:hypothetical protein